MSARALYYWDGANFPLVRLELMTSSGARDLTDCALYMDVWRDGAFVARRPGRILTPKTAGVVEFFLRGRETDTNQGGGSLTLYPFLLVPYTVATPSVKATNLLLNPSFNTYTGTSPTRLPTSWSLVGAQSSEVFDAYENDLARPASIFEGGAFWFAEPGATSVTYLEQTVAQSTAIGDWITLGAWVRSTAPSPGWALNANCCLEMDPSGASDTASVQYACEQDWTFHYTELMTTAAHTSITARLRYSGAVVGSMRFDEACLFVGRYRELPMRPISVPVYARPRVVKTGGNALAGIGGFERDYNADGLPDGWQLSQAIAGSGVTLSLASGAADVKEGAHSLKGVCVATAAGLNLRAFKRYHFRAGEVWKLSIWWKDNGITPSPTMLMLAEPFTNGAGYRYQSSSVTLSNTSWTEYEVSTAALPYDCDALECRVSFPGATGTFWIDDVRLTRV